ncbi:MAG: alpha/beta hydrolase [Rhodomicrobiaceae bacterium]
MQTLLTIAGIGAGLYLVLAVSIYAFQRSLIFYPDATYSTPAESGLSGVNEVKLTTPDGETLIAWYAEADPGQPTILYFHGNAGNLVNRAPRIERFARAGYGTFMLAYRGYGGSTGKPSESAIVADAALAYDHLRGLGVPSRDILAYGESLGSGVAVQLAATHEVGALILDAPYTSLPAIGKRLYPFLPVETFMTDRFDSERHIAKVRAPILILHGTNDGVIPVELGRELFETAHEPKVMAELEGAGHSDIYMFDALEHLERFIAQHRENADRREPAEASQ